MMDAVKPRYSEAGTIVYLRNLPFKSTKGREQDVLKYCVDLK
jgi:hypothetical protein